jgi:hypothetical protein
VSSIALRPAIIIGRAILILPLLSAAMLWASVSGSIAGTAKDPSGNVVVNAQVSVRETGTGISHTTRTDSKGYYTFPVLAIGHYVLDVEASGFGRYER